LPLADYMPIAARHADYAVAAAIRLITLSFFIITTILPLSPDAVFFISPALFFAFMLSLIFRHFRRFFIFSSLFIGHAFQPRFRAFSYASATGFFIAATLLTATLRCFRRHYYFQ
jgi:hypothetical protein